MYLPQKEKNKYTIGKLLRTSKLLRKFDSTAKIVPMPKQLQQYTEQLKQKGLKIKNLQFAMFQTKNGLSYPGLIASQKILTNTIMLRVPVQCLLTTRIAFFSQIQKVFEQNPQFFSKNFTIDWEDHILLAFILYEYQKKQKSQWYNLIRNLPKQIDYAIFWDQKYLEIMQDKRMQLGISQEKQKFVKETKQFIQICQRYPQYFKAETINLDNIKWIQSHLVTRCFGKYFQYTTMVPFAQLFNHQCTDVYYSMDYKPGNPNTQNQVFFDQKQLTQQQMDEANSSDGSYDAEDYYQPDQIIRKDQDQVVLEQNPKTKNESILKDIKSIKSYMLTFISFNDSVSFPYLSQILKQLQLLQKFISKSQEQQIAIKQRLQAIHSANVKYVKLVKQFYSSLKSSVYTYGLKQKKKNSILQNLKEKEVTPPFFPTDWPKDKFDQFVMLCSTKDQFQKGSQVFFCYGRLPNKLLLLRYGIALQYNKYNHIFLRLNVESQVKRIGAFKQIVYNDIDMNKYRRFKIKRTKICVELITYIRSKHWMLLTNIQDIFYVNDLKKECQVLMEVQDIMIEELSRFKDPIQKNKQKLTDKGLGYHGYFSLIHKIENQQIFVWQIKMLKYALQIISKLSNSKNINLKTLLISETNKQKLTMQIMMQSYFKYFPVT